MKVKMGKTYPDGSQDIVFEEMDEEMKETLIRLGMIKVIEDSVKANQDWLRGVDDED